MLENQFRHELHNQTERIKPMMDEYVQEFSKKIATHSDSMVTAFTSKMRGVLTGHEMTLSQSVSAFKDNINDVVTKATETVNTNLNSLTSTFQQRFVRQAEEVTINFHQMVQEANESRFNTPKVTQPARDTHPAFITATTVKTNRDPTVSSIQPPTDDTPISSLLHPKMQTDDSAPKTTSRWNLDPKYRQKLEQFTPTEPFACSNDHRRDTVQATPASYHSNTELPLLQYDNIMKRVTSVQFTGQENLLVFYHQLMNSLSPYGCYIRPIADIKVDETICPETWEGIPISNSRYKTMAACLYQKLASIVVIPLDFTAARNIVNQFAQDNDGYKVLYSLMAPLIRRDDIETWPQMIDCPDIHTYALKVTSYLNSEALKGRLYRQREQVSHFLLGLESDPQYIFAVKCARNLLETGTGNPTDPSVPSALKLAVLPTTIDRYKKEEGSTAIICTLNGQAELDRQATIRAINFNSRDTHQAADRLRDRFKTRNGYQDGRNPKTDKPCPVCYHSGHTRSNCNGFPKFLLFRLAEQSTDAAARTKLIDSYKQNIKQKAELRQKRQHLSTIRQMWANGSSFEEMEASLIASMPEYPTELSDSDTSSSEE